MANNNQQFPLAGLGGMLGDMMGRLMQPGAMGPMGGMANANQTFCKKYKVFSVACAQNKASLEAGDKILLPASALDQLARLRVTYPMMFQVSNCSPGADPRTHKTHCGVMEFSSEEGIAYLPYWMMQNLLVENGGIVEIRNVSLPKGNFVQFQPHSTKFTSLHNPRVVLERALRNYACLSKGDTIAIQHGDDQYYLDVIETKPAAAISIIETDVNVDFIAAKDAPKEDTYKQQQQQQAQSDFKFHIPDDADHKSGTIVEAPVATSTSTTTSSSTPVNNSYFAKLGSGNRLTNKKPANKSPALTATTTPTTATTTSRPASQSVASSTARPTTASTTTTSTSRPASASVSSTSSTSTSTSSDGLIYEPGSKFTYVYRMEGQTKKLVKRVPNAAGTGAGAGAGTGTGTFKPFAGAGNTLK